jgi:hypothetical protein
MIKTKLGQKLSIAVTLIAFCVGVFAETVVYKWVDEDGVVHFGDAPPDESTAAEALVIPKAPPAPAPAEPAASVPPVSEPASQNAPVPDAAPMPFLYEKTDISKMSIADLNIRCDEARERMIAPLREAEIAKCKQDKREDPAFCERFNADFGDGGRTASGSIRPRMFDDLPECVEAMQETNRRQR